MAIQPLPKKIKLLALAGNRWARASEPDENGFGEIVDSGNSDMVVGQRVKIKPHPSGMCWVWDVVLTKAKGE